MSVIKNKCENIKCQEDRGARYWDRKTKAEYCERCYWRMYPEKPAKDLTSAKR